jgi:hypothetical protein
MTMQFMLMCCFEERAWNRLAQAERDQVMKDYGEWIQNLIDSGRFRGGAKLEQAQSAKTVRMKDGKTVLTDGPFAETKEQFGGYHLVECQDLEEALAIAGRIPTLPAGGAVEVRCVTYSDTELSA